MLQETEILMPRAEMYSFQSHGSSRKPFPIGVYIFLIMEPIVGIYQIQSKTNPEKIYIGSTVNFRIRKKCHLRELKKNKHHSYKIQKHYNKYGKDDLVFSLLLSCERSELLNKEQFFIDSMNPFLNVLKIAGSSMGRVVSEETRRRISEGNKGKKLSDEARKNISEGHKGIGKGIKTGRIPPNAFQKGHIPWGKGKKASIETRRKISEAGLKRSPEVAIKISKANKGNKSFLGKTHSEESKIKMSLVKKGKKMSDETKEKQRLRMMGNKNTLGHKVSASRLEQIRDQMRNHNPMLGRKHSIETLTKMKLVKLGKKQSLETIEKRVSKLRGRKYSKRILGTEIKK